MMGAALMLLQIQETSNEVFFAFINITFIGLFFHKLKHCERSTKYYKVVSYTYTKQVAMVVNTLAHHMPVIAEGATIPDDAPFIESDNLIPHETTPFVRYKRRSSSTSSIFPDDFFVPEKLGLVSFSILVFYNVSGGPFGVEASVRAGGNFYSLLGFLVVPLIWSLQEAAMTAELGAAFPEASGGVAWVEEAFGSTAGWMSGYLNWVAGATDNAIYPVLFLEYVMQIFKASVLEEIESAHSDTMHHLIRIFLITAISTSLAYINWLGLELVGRISILICFVAMSPFVLLLLVGAAKCDPSRWFEIPDQICSDHTVSFWESGFVTTGVLWRPLINNLYWNLNSFDAAGSFAADVDDPNKTFARGMMWGLLLVTIGYFVPLLIATGASDTPHSKWVEGYLAGIAFDVGGVWLGAWTVFAAGVSNIAMFQAEMSADAYQVMGMAERGFLPKIFARRSRQGTPTYGILLGTAVIIVASSFSNFDELVEMLNFMYTLSLVFEFAAFIKLRVSHSETHRPWKVPLNTFGCILFLLPTMVFMVIIIVIASWKSYVFALVFGMIGFFLFLSSESRRQASRRNKEGSSADDKDKL
ncbi:hypothetical protein FisN_5Lh337 [Fistulifera solaris]|uniref:Uncharacterized protein n=1 Tax=Fistulifera solaris TaxID=1519565 RepID=A0A1Z5KGK8_FISSO|nr:hypothetical protein FisN_5Lh337 [Fistulifera solaris]|eukprot:GAX25255.1 hypothetical protein FisN_5Lh337 [Fistulifera solaris]